MSGTRGPEARPVILLGAARSGTKFLRSILGSHSLLGAVPYDINYVWMMGNYGKKHDELTAAELQEDTRRFIRSYLERFRPADGAGRVVEKTVSNTLRLPFVDAVFPEAQYVVILRDGRDVAASAREQWRSRSSGGSLLTKLQTFPARHAWRYAVAYLGNYFSGLLPWRNSLKSWGPRYRGMAEDLRKLTVLETCAWQWRHCVQETLAGMAGIGPDRVHVVRYEQLVASPLTETRKILDFIGLDMENSIEVFCRERVSAANVGKWRGQLTPDEAKAVAGIVMPVMDRDEFPRLSQTVAGE